MADAPTLQSRFRGCLLGGAVGDALGAPVEFDTHAQIVARYGLEGPGELGRAYGVKGAVTDDTQMTLWTAEGLLRAAHQGQVEGEDDGAEVVDRSYLHWLLTQGETQPEGTPDVTWGWLREQSALYARRAPGETCLSALRSGQMGRPRAPVNDSKGCGGVMRVAPAGLLFDPDDAFDVACEIAAITHGHPTGYVAAGALATVIAMLCDGHPVADVLFAVEGFVRETVPGGTETARALGDARRLAASDVPDAEAVAALALVTPSRGAGWVAEEALAVAALCARRYPEDLERAVRMAVTHTGDSDSTGSICGQILGAALGEEAVPARWTAAVEMRGVVVQVADDLHACAVGERGWEGRYPGW